jgi:hypothetical protein
LCDGGLRRGTREIGTENGRKKLPGLSGKASESKTRWNISLSMMIKELKMIEAGKKAPAFSLPNQDGKKISLKDFSGKWLILYFYPKDNTSG